MSVQSEVERIRQNVANAYNAVLERGGKIPEQANSGNLAAAISSLPDGGSDGLYGFHVNDEGHLIYSYTGDEAPNFSIENGHLYADIPPKIDLGSVVGPKGEDGKQGPAGQGVPSGGTTGQVLAKKSNANYETEWVDAPDAQEVFSTDEVRIGTWVDGKPLYRKVFQFTSPNSANVAATAIEDLGIDGLLPSNVVSIRGILYKASGAVYPIPGSKGADQHISIWVNSIGNLQMDISSDFTKMKCYAILEYIKDSSQSMIKISSLEAQALKDEKNNTTTHFQDMKQLPQATQRM